MTTPEKEPTEPPTPQPANPFVPQPRPSEEDLRELWEPDDQLGPEYPWLPGRPGFVVVIDQLRGRWPDQPPSLAELLERLSRTNNPEPDMEAEP